MLDLKNFFAVFLSSLFLLSLAATAQDLKSKRAQHREMLETIKSDIEKKYYDPQFRGINLEEKYRLAADLINQANSTGEMSGVITRFLLEFDDSHLFFVPPMRVDDVEYGWTMQIVGDKAFVTEVEPDSDAARQGLKPGDQIYSIESFAPTRENLWKINYFYNVLQPQPALRVFAIKPDGRKFQYALQAKVIKGKSVYGENVNDWNLLDRKFDKYYSKARKAVFYDGIEGLAIWKLPAFFQETYEVDDLFGKIKKSRALILDLRGNGGGLVSTNARILANLFGEDVKIGDRKERKETKPEIAKSRGKAAFKGDLVVLIDSESASASEVLARVVQLEKRGTVIGDRSAGAVMTSIRIRHESGVGYVVPYGLSVTIADLIMKDGKSLEKIGVAPDEIVLPTAQDLANKLDPVLARAAQKLGFELAAEKAAQISAAGK